MREEPNVLAFCRELRKHGLELLDGVDPLLSDFINDQLQHSDICYSESIQADLESAWYDGPKPAIAAALETYLEVVREWLDRFLGPDSFFPWHEIGMSNEQRENLYYAVDLIQLRKVPKIAAALEAAAESDTPEIP